MKYKLYQHALLLTGMALYSTAAHAALTPISLPGSTGNDTWNNIDAVNFPIASYGTNQEWPTPIGSNIGGDAGLTKQFNNTAGTVAQFPGLSGAGNGLLTVTDSTPLAELETIVFQLDYSAFASGGDPGSELLVPELTLNDVTFGANGQADYFAGSDLSDQPHPNPTLADLGFTVSAGSYAWQWDLSGYGDSINSLTIEWTHPSGGAVLNSLQLDQGNQFSQVVVPEPSTYAALFGAGVLAFALWRRWIRR